MPDAATTFYEAVGGEETFRRLVHGFYSGVAEDPLLRPLYPEEDLTGAEERLRHVPHPVLGRPAHLLRAARPPAAADAARPVRTSVRRARDAWLRHMRDAVDIARPARATPRTCSGTTC